MTLEIAVQSAGYQDEFLTHFRSGFTSTLRWHQFDRLWELLRTQNPEGWYIYAVGEAPPETRCTAAQFFKFLEEMAVLLRREHDEDYCGIVYADNLSRPSFVKIFDPNNLGVSCGYSDNPPLPGWILSRIRPVDLAAATQSASRKRWWRRLFS